MNQEKIKVVREHVAQTHGEFSQPAKAYIIFFNPRSGSNLITTHLQSIGFGNPFEAFHYNQQRLRKEQGWGFDFSDSPVYLRKVIETLTVNHVFGMKINWRQFENFISVLKDIVGEMGQDLTDTELIEVFFPGVKYLFLKRRNKLKQAISFSKGMQTGMWKVSPSRYELLREYTIPADYDREHIECCLDELLAYDESWENFLEESKVEPYRIWYEDFAKDFQENMLALYKYLGVDENISEPQPLTKRLANKQSEQWLEDFIQQTGWLEDEALYQALVDGNTRYAFTARASLVFFSKGQDRWHRMPRNRFKQVKYLIFRGKVKLRKILNR